MFMKKFLTIKHFLDFSNFSKDSKFYDNQNENWKQGNSD